MNDTTTTNDLSNYNKAVEASNEVAGAEGRNVFLRTLATLEGWRVKNEEGIRSVCFPAKRFPHRKVNGKKLFIPSNASRGLLILGLSSAQYHYIKTGENTRNLPLVLNADTGRYDQNKMLHRALVLGLIGTGTHSVNEECNSGTIWHRKSGAFIFAVHKGGDDILIDPYSNGLNVREFYNKRVKSFKEGTREYYENVFLWVKHMTTGGGGHFMRGVSLPLSDVVKLLNENAQKAKEVEETREALYAIIENKLSRKEAEELIENFSDLKMFKEEKKWFSLLHTVAYKVTKRQKVRIGYCQTIKNLEDWEMEQVNKKRAEQEALKQKEKEIAEQKEKEKKAKFEATLKEMKIPREKWDSMTAKQQRIAIHNHNRKK